MLSGEIELLEGCRQLVELAGRLDERDDEILAPIVAVESETDDLPLGDSRAHWSEQGLRRKDATVAAYLLEVRPVIMKAVELLVARYSR